MSVKASSWVWQHSASEGTERLVMLALADQCDDNGECFPGVEHIARKCRIAPRTVQDALKRAEDRGELVRSFRQGRSTVYRIIMDTPAESAPPQNLHPSDQTGDAPARTTPPQNLHRGVRAPAPITVTYPVSEPIHPPTVGVATSTARGTRLPDDWQPSEALIAWTRANCPHVGSAEAERFRDYWIAQPGIKGRKANWDATWRSWARRAEDEAPRANGQRSTGDERVATALALAAKYAAEDGMELGEALAANPRPARRLAIGGGP